MARLVIINGPEAGGELPLRPGVNWLGRAGINALVLTDAGISGRHCQIVLSTGSLRVRDLGSTNGTYVDGQSVLETELADGQILALGALQLKVDNPPFEISIPATTQPEPARPRLLANGTPPAKTMTAWPPRGVASSAPAPFVTSASTNCASRGMRPRACFARPAAANVT